MLIIRKLHFRYTFGTMFLPGWYILFLSIHVYTYMPDRGGAGICYETGGADDTACVERVYRSVSAILGDHLGWDGMVDTEAIMVLLS